MSENNMTMGRVDMSVESGIKVVTLKRPPHNLLTEPLLRQIADALHQVDSLTRAVVLCSEGRSFCAGADFKSNEAPDPTQGSSFEVQTGAFYRQAARIFATPLPVVAAVQGAAIGAGFGLALACDIRVLGADAWFQANFVNLGIHPGFALSTMLPRFVGPGRASELFLTGRRINAQEAHAAGMAEHLVAKGSEKQKAIEIASAIADAAPLAVASTRATLRMRLEEIARKAMEHELAEQSRLAGTKDAIEGVSAMLERRKPNFQGR